MQSLFLTDRGQIRNLNEDFGGVYFNSFGQLLAVIADGMGGHNAGDVASQMMTELLGEKWKKTEKKLDSPIQLEQWLHNVIIDVNRVIYDQSKEEKSLCGMGTTVAAVICTDEFVTVAHVGDSRCYLLNNEGFSQLTDDHSLVNELVRIGQIKQEDAEEHPRRNVLLKAVGTEQIVKPDVQTVCWRKGDFLLLCSDGLTNKIENEEMKEVIKRDHDIEKIGKTLIRLANHRGGEDNISLILIHYDQPLEMSDSSC